MTLFCYKEIEVDDNVKLFVDGNSKITAEDGTYDEPVPNAFSLPHVSTCPGSTEDCRDGCYVHGLQEHAGETYAKYVQNERCIHMALMSHPTAHRAARALGKYISENCSRFRWHVSGDVFSLRYALWITEVCSLSPDTKHWIYTRSLPLVRDLITAQNLEVNVSADSKNWVDAKAHADAYDLRLCYFSRDGSFPEELRDREKSSVIFPDYNLRGRKLDDPTSAPWWQGIDQGARKMVCPADFFGQSQNMRCGPCKKCFADA